MACIRSFSIRFGVTFKYNISKHVFCINGTRRYRDICSSVSKHRRHIYGAYIVLQYRNKPKNDLISCLSVTRLGTTPIRDDNVTKMGLSKRSLGKHICKFMFYQPHNWEFLRCNIYNKGIRKFDFESYSNV